MMSLERPDFIPDEKYNDDGVLVPDLKAGFYSERGWIDLEECKWADFPPEGATSYTRQIPRTPSS